jgi:L-iditol 2-dehydrogenase
VTSNSTMRIARYYNNNDVRIEFVKIPSIADGEILVRVMACGICGSDVMEWFRVPKSPRVLGHEIAGVIEDSRSAHYARGDRVVVRNQISCGECHACENGHPGVCEKSQEIEPGGMAEHIRLPRKVVQNGVSKLPPNLSFCTGTLAEPLACVLHSHALARIEARHCIAVVGCGVFGLLHIQAARNSGVDRIVAIEKTEYRMRAAERLGPTVLHPNQNLPREIKKINDGRLADVAIVATGSPGGLKTACEVVGRYGTILLFGMPAPDVPLGLSLNELFWRKELVIVSSYGPGDVPFSEPLRLIETGAIEVDDLITHRVPFKDVKQGFETVAKAEQSLKVVLEMFETQ